MLVNRPLPSDDPCTACNGQGTTLTPYSIKTGGHWLMPCEVCLGSGRKSDMIVIRPNRTEP